jgi:hypothetical protein
MSDVISVEPAGSVGRAARATSLEKEARILVVGRWLLMGIPRREVLWRVMHQWRLSRRRALEYVKAAQQRMKPDEVLGRASKGRQKHGLSSLSSNERVETIAPTYELRD